MEKQFDHSASSLRPFILALILVFGGLLRINEWLSGRSLWLDEAFLALNIVEKGVWDLLGPLDYHQAAPPGFLLFEKASVLLFGNGELQLRLPALLASLAGLVLFVCFAFRRLSYLVAVVVSLLFATNDSLLYYAGEAKPYAFDVLGVVVCCFLISEATGARYRFYLVLLGICGALLPAFSLVGPLVFGCGIVALVFNRALKRQSLWLSGVALVLFVWALGYFGLLELYSSNALARGFFQLFWSSHFLPALYDLPWLANNFAKPFVTLIDNSSSPYLFTFLMTTGCIVSLGHLKLVAFFSVLCGVALPLFSYLEYFPFFPRFYLFLIPCGIYFFGIGFGALIGWTHARNRAVSAVVVLLIVLTTLYSPLRGVMQGRQVQELEYALAHISKEQRSGDRIYLFHLTAYPFLYYAKRYGLNDQLALPSDYFGGHPKSEGQEPVPLLFSRPGFSDIVVGATSYFAEDHSRGLELDLEMLAGNKRVWVLVSNGEGSSAAQSTLLGRMRETGRMLESIVWPGRWGGVVLCLFDFSNVP
jgi:hypothetical protein